jgi:hypothetical protein
VSDVAAYQRGYDDGVEQERASIAKELGRLSDPEIVMWSRGFIRGYHLTREPCPTCTGTARETVGMVCQDCGTDYGVRP